VGKRWNALCVNFKRLKPNIFRNISRYNKTLYKGSQRMTNIRCQMMAYLVTGAGKWSGCVRCSLLSHFWLLSGCWIHGYFSITNYWRPGLVAHTCTPSTLEAETGGLQVWGQPGLHSNSLSQTPRAGDIVQCMHFQACTKVWAQCPARTRMHTHTHTHTHNITKTKLTLYDQLGLIPGMQLM
jgi:hypothetical protein